MEDKQKICDRLLALLRETRDLFHILEIRYDKNGLAYAKYATGKKLVINVDGMNGSDMILEILKQLKERPK